MGRLELGPWPSSRVTGMSVESTKINIPPNMKHVMADAQKDLGKNNLENLEPRKQCRRGRCKREENSVSLVNAKRWGAGSAARRRASPRRRTQNKAWLFWPRPAHKRTRPQVTGYSTEIAARTMSMCYGHLTHSHTSRSPTQPHRPRPLGAPDAGCSQRSMAAGLLRARMPHLSPTCIQTPC